MNLARIGNKYLADSEPWKTAKTEMARTATILNLSLQIVANLAIVCEPFLPFSAKKIYSFLLAEKFDWEKLGSFDLLPAGHQLGTAELLFEKIEDEAIARQVENFTQPGRPTSRSHTRPSQSRKRFFSTISANWISVWEQYWSAKRYRKRTNCCGSCSTTVSANAPSSLELQPITPIPGNWWANRSALLPTWNRENCGAFSPRG